MLCLSSIWFNFGFLMSFTLRAGEMPDGLGFFPTTEPEIGFVAAVLYWFEQAADRYQTVHTTLAAPINDHAQVKQAVADLHVAAQLEREVVKILLVDSGAGLRARRTPR
jgi:hypothetical protein